MGKITTYGKIIQRLGASVMVGTLGLAGLSACAHQQPGPRLQSRCPEALRVAEVSIVDTTESDIRVRVVAPAGGDGAAIAQHSEQIAEALSQHPETTVGASEEVRAAPGREVRIVTVPSGIELAFTSSGLLGMEVLRRRIHDRVDRWQNGACPRLDQGLERWEVTRDSDPNKADSNGDKRGDVVSRSEPTAEPAL